MRPGCGKRPTSGGLPPETRALISVSQEPALVNLMVMPLALANSLTSDWNPTSCSLEKPYITSMVLLPVPPAAPPLLPLLPLSPELDERQPEARPATAIAARAVPVALRFFIPVLLLWSPGQCALT